MRAGVWTWLHFRFKRYVTPRKRITRTPSTATTTPMIRPICEEPAASWTAVVDEAGCAITGDTVGWTKTEGVMMGVGVGMIVGEVIIFDTARLETELRVGDASSVDVVDETSVEWRAGAIGRARIRRLCGDLEVQREVMYVYGGQF